MGGTRELLGNVLADSLLPLLRRPMEDVVYETLDRRDVPSRAEVHEFVETQDSATLALRVKALETQVGKLEDTIAELRKQLSQTAKRTASSSKSGSGSKKKSASNKNASPRKSTKASSEAETCRVSDCKETPRSRGFCARHYQKWRRGTLEGFSKGDK